MHFRLATAIATAPLFLFAAEPAASQSRAGDAAADLALSSLGQARFVLARGGAQADSLARRAAARSLDVEIVVVGDPSRPDEEKLSRLASAAGSLGAPKGALAALDIGPAVFFAVWLREDPGVARHVRLAAFPTLVDTLAPGFSAVPDGFLFAPVPDSEITPDFLRASAKRFAAARDELGEILLSVPGGASGDAALAPWTQLAGCAGNNLGCLLAEAGLEEDAAAAFRAADTVNPGGASPLLNLATLAKRGVGAAVRDDLAKRLGALPASSFAGSSLAVGGGYVLQPEDFFPARWFWTVTGLRKPGKERVDALLAAAETQGGAEMKRAVAKMLAVERTMRSAFAAPLVDAFDSLGVAQEGGWTPRTAAVVARMLFDSNARAAALRLLGRVSASDAKAEGEGTGPALELALLRLDFLGRMGDKDAIAGHRGVFRALPAGETFRAANLALASAAADAEDWAGAASDWKAVADSAGGAEAVPWAAAAARAAAALAAGKAQEAKDAFADAASAGAGDSWAALCAGLMADFATGDKPAAVAKARRIVELRPRCGFANFVLANTAAEDGRMEESLFRYQASLAERFNWLAANDFASLLAKTGKAEMAERIARDALSAGGDKYAAVHDTLGETLAAQKRWPEALAAFRKAAAMPGGRMPEVLLHLAEALVASGEKTAAAELIPEIDAGKSSFSIRDRERLGALRHAVSD